MAASDIAPNKTFGQHLVDRREKLGMSRRQFAAKVGVSHVAAGYWEHDENLPESGTLPVIARALRCSTSTVGRWIDDSPLVTLAGHGPGLLNLFRYPSLAAA